MTQITLKIKDSKVRFFKELIKNFDFVQIEKEESTEPSKEEIAENIKQGIEEVKMIEEGKMEGASFKDFLDEL